MNLKHLAAEAANELGRTVKTSKSGAKVVRMDAVTQAWIRAHKPVVLRGLKADGTVAYEESWWPEEITAASNVNGNITSKRAFRAGNRAELGIVAIDVIKDVELYEKALALAKAKADEEKKAGRK